MDQINSKTQRLADPIIETAERITIGSIDGQVTTIERNFDGECGGWVGQVWFDLTKDQYEAARALAMRP